VALARFDQIHQIHTIESRDEDVALDAYLLSFNKLRTFVRKHERRFNHLEIDIEFH